MKSQHIINTIDSHTGGEPTRLITSGVPIRGSSILEQRNFVREHYDHLRSALLREPRGHRGMFGAILCPPTSTNVDFGIIWVDHDGSYLNMCGHGTIGIGVSVVECGLVPVNEPLTRVKVDMPAGLVEIDINVEQGCAKFATLTNVAAFVYKRDVDIEIEGYGRLSVDISFGGSFFGAIRDDKLGVEVRPENTPALVRAGLAIRKALNERVKVQHPTLSHIQGVDLVTIYGKGMQPGAKYKNIHVFSDGSFDRSPGGTGTSHMMALLIDRGEMDPDEEIISEGITGSLFHGRMIGREKVGEFKAFVPQVRGEAYITGFHQFVIDPDDPLKEGINIG